MTDPIDPHSKNTAPLKSGEEMIPLAIDEDDGKDTILNELIRAEEHYVKKIHSANHSIGHEILSDSSAIVGAATTLNWIYFKSLLAVTPIIGMLLWEKHQAQKDLKRLHRVTELFEKTGNPLYLHSLRLELEGIPVSDDLSNDEKIKIETDISEILKKPTSFGGSVKNLKHKIKKSDTDKVSDNLTSTPIQQAREIGRKLISGSKDGANFVFDMVKDLKNLTSLPVNYLKASFTIARQGTGILLYPLKAPFQRASRPKKKVKAEKKQNKQDKKDEETGVTIAKVKASETASFATSPHALKREIRRIKAGLKSAAIETGVNTIAFTCQTLFVLNQALVTHNLIGQNKWMTAAGVAIPSLLALSPLNYFAKNQLDKDKQMHSDRADMAKRLEQHAETLEAVKQVKNMIDEIHDEQDQGEHLEIAQDIIDMYGDDFNPDWFEKEHRQKLEKLFNLLASQDDDKAEELEKSAIANNSLSGLNLPGKNSQDPQNPSY